MHARVYAYLQCRPEAQGKPKKLVDWSLLHPYAWLVLIQNSFVFNDNWFHALFTKMTGLFSSDLWHCGIQGDTVLITLNAVCKNKSKRQAEGGRREGCGHKLRVIVSLLLQTKQLFVEV